MAREWQIAGAAGFPLDDSWIHLQFARNLAAGAGFSYNPGTPVAGSTAPLWTLLLGAVAFVASPSLGMVKAVGIAATVAAALVTRWWLARRFRGLTIPTLGAVCEVASVAVLLVLAARLPEAVTIV